MDMIWKENNIFYNILCFLITENEKIFDKSDKKLYWRTIFHSCCISLYCYLGVFTIFNFNLDNHLDVIIQTVNEFNYGLLTTWNIVFQSLFITLSLIHDLLEWCNNHQTKVGLKIKYYRDIVFCSLVTPFTMFVSGMFWSLYWIDRDLVFPKVFDDIVPWWFNHCVHTNIMVIYLLETIITSRRHPIDRKVELNIVAFTTILYAVVYYSIYFITHRWLYNVFGYMTWWQVVLYQCGIFLVMFIFYKIQFPLNRLFHKREVEEVNGKIENNVDTPEDMNANSQCFDESQNDKLSNGSPSDKLSNGTPNDKSSPFFDKEWRLKYRSIRDQFEKTKF